MKPEKITHVDQLFEADKEPAERVKRKKDAFQEKKLAKLYG